MHIRPFQGQLYAGTLGKRTGRVRECRRRRRHIRIGRGEAPAKNGNVNVNPFRVQTKRLFPTPRALPLALHIRPFQGQLYAGTIGKRTGRVRGCRRRRRHIRIGRGEAPAKNGNVNVNPFRVQTKRLFPTPRALPSAMHIRPFQGQLYAGTIGKRTGRVRECRRRRRHIRIGRGEAPAKNGNVNVNPVPKEWLRQRGSITWLRKISNDVKL
jgi:hypothetical protein